MSKTKGLIHAMVILLFFSCSGDTNADNKTIDETKGIYTQLTINGFSVFIEKRAFEINETLTNRALDQLKKDLTEITALNIKPNILTQLKLTQVFVDWNTTNGAAVYHPTKQWLIDNGYYEGKAKSIEISNIQNYVSWISLNQPYMLLHEFSHAYHDRVFGFNHPQITNAFTSAQYTKLYTNVSYHSGNQNYNTVTSAYALTNEKEYFAELTEAYFGLNDFFPFNKSELQLYDPAGYQMIEAVWEQ